MSAPILVTGGTGRLGHHVVTGLRATGHEVRVLSRHGSPPADGVESVIADLRNGAAIQSAVDGTSVIVHCAGSRKGDDETTRNLVLAATRAGVEHLVYISVIGADRVPIVSAVDRAGFGYFGYKLAAERIVAESGLPWTTLRAAQFHDAFLALAGQMAKLPVIPVPAGFRFQPVDEREVADRLVELALDAPAGLVPEFGGPRIHTMADLLRGYLRAAGKHRLLLPVATIGRAAAAIRAGANLAPDRAVGRRTWEEVLAERVSAPRERSSEPA